MKLKILLFTLIISSLCSNILLASSGSPMDKYLSKINIFETKDGRKFKSFEDVQVKLDPFQERNEEYPIVNENEIPEGYVSKKTANNYFKKFSSHAVVTEEETTFQDFMNEHFFLYSEDAGVNIVKSFPVNFMFTDPIKKRFYLRMDDSYKYVSRFKKFGVDALSCSSCKSLCGSQCKNSHVYGSNNIYSEFKSKLMDNSKITEAEEVDNHDNYIELELKNRTPPGAAKGFLTLGVDPFEMDRKNTVAYYFSTSGDWYMTEYFPIATRTADVHYAKFSFGRINVCPQDGRDWRDFEDWSHVENIVKCEYNTTPFTDGGDEEIAFYSFRDLVKFYPFSGVLRYSLYVKEGEAEGDGNLNPGVAKVIEDAPEQCYGYKEGGDLGVDPNTAKDWPDKRRLSEVSGKGQDTGTIRIYDDDRPNIIIRITNTENETQLFFPPCPASNAVEITNSSIYQAVSGMNKTNKDDYMYFVGDKLDSFYDCDIMAQFPNYRPYFTIFQINDVDITNAEGTRYFERFLHNKDLEFINKNTRVEDYFYSDKSMLGDFEYKAEKGELGKREGTFKKMVALIENSGVFRFKTGVEYKLDVWTDDNVKWTNIDEKSGREKINYQAVKNDNGRIKMSFGPTAKDSDGTSMFYEPDILEYAKVYHTGIKKGKINLRIPNASENLNEEKDIDVRKAINGDIYFTLKEGTSPARDLKTVKDLDDNNFPYISVEVEDFYGFTRELKLYFRVNDNNTEVRTIVNPMDGR